jgi:integrase
LPEFVTVREARIRVAQRGFRTKVIVVVTTLLDPQQVTKEDLAALYRARWHNELDLRTIKSTMQMPLWWDAGTLVDPAAWRAQRVIDGAGDRDPLVVTPRGKRRGTALSRHTLRKRFRTVCKVLGLVRLETLTIQHGRHTFLSHALAGERTLAEVRDAAGHSNVSITSAYLHALIDDESKVGWLFDFRL